MEGNPVLLDISDSWLCLATSNGFLRIYDLSARLDTGCEYLYSKKLTQSLRFISIMNKNNVHTTIYFAVRRGNSIGQNMYLKQLMIITALLVLNSTKLAIA